MVKIAENEGITITKLEQKIGASKGVLSRAIAQNSDIQSKWLLRLVENYPQYNTNWILSEHGEMLKSEKETLSVHESRTQYRPKSIPLLPLEAFAGLGESNVAGVDFDTIEERYDVPLFYNIRVDFMINVRGSSMYPKYSSGDVVACRMVNDLLFVQWNKIYVIDTISQGIIMKRLKKSKIDGNIVCKSDNHEYDEFEVPMNDIRNIALVVGSIRLE
ncbi:MAG: hypothetical protein LC112_07600 [Flavobacteriales bacterium]|nr:hypothetical protein [Flavobacteriales bacterium]